MGFQTKIFYFDRLGNDRTIRSSNDFISSYKYHARKPLAFAYTSHPKGNVWESVLILRPEEEGSRRVACHMVPS
ncbi:MAG: hypothetical protein ACI8ZB_004168 [Desulforhopalus sp.]|jgi:hypothetical protein